MSLDEILLWDRFTPNPYLILTLTLTLFSGIGLYLVSYQTLPHIGQGGYITTLYIALMLIISNACTQAPQSYGPILMANVIDESQELTLKEEGQSFNEHASEAKNRNEAKHRNEAKTELSGGGSQSMFWAMNALCVKPFNSVGPILGMAVLGEPYKLFVAQPGQIPSQELWQQALSLLALSTSVCAGVSLLSWRGYTLHGKKLRVLQQRGDVESL